ncbi:hypothetical protein FBX97_0221 [Herbaspirillum sp. SJZ107]|jgi:hypothetical protein|nr:hypothetical protein FBX97_0221 [Herbaspirillum sp. SJZ107]
MDVLYICATVVLTALACGLAQACAKLGGKQ